MLLYIFVAFNYIDSPIKFRRLIWGLDIPDGASNMDYSLQSVYDDNMSTWNCLREYLSGGIFSCFFESIGSCSIEDLSMSELNQLGVTGYDDTQRVKLAEYRRGLSSFVAPLNTHSSQLFPVNFTHDEWTSSLIEYTFRLQPLINEQFNFRWRKINSIYNNSRSHPDALSSINSDELNDDVDLDYDMDVTGFISTGEVRRVSSSILSMVENDEISSRSRNNDNIWNDNIWGMYAPSVDHPRDFSNNKLSCPIDDIRKILITIASHLEVCQSFDYPSVIILFTDTDHCKETQTEILQVAYNHKIPEHVTFRFFTNMESVDNIVDQCSTTTNQCASDKVGQISLVPENFGKGVQALFSLTRSSRLFTKV